jgi:hypothetical protein
LIAIPYSATLLSSIGSDKQGGALVQGFRLQEKGPAIIPLPHVLCKAQMVASKPLPDVVHLAPFL